MRLRGGGGGRGFAGERAAVGAALGGAGVAEMCDGVEEDGAGVASTSAAVRRVNRWFMA